MFNPVNNQLSILETSSLCSEVSVLGWLKDTNISFSSLLLVLCNSARSFILKYQHTISLHNRKILIVTATVTASAINSGYCIKNTLVNQLVPNPSRLAANDNALTPPEAA